MLHPASLPGKRTHCQCVTPHCPGAQTNYIPALCCRLDITVLCAEKPVFGAQITLNQNCVDKDCKTITPGQTLAWLTHEVCDTLFLSGLNQPLNRFFTIDQLRLTAKQALSIVRCDYRVETGILFCFSIA